MRLAVFPSGPYDVSAYFGTVHTILEHLEDPRRQQQEQLERLEAERERLLMGPG